VGITQCTVYKNYQRYTHLQIINPYCSYASLIVATPLGSMPVLYIDDYALGQSIAIAMYVAREANLVGCNNIEAAQVQMLFESTQEAFNGYAKIVFAGGNDEEKV